ncbi:DNA starvation/stationary phase protection protein [Campylobacter sp. RM9344]|uniref:DNA starvation/stationary phase protection protein n=1 Tax=Campylobacter californiensis TaxID=1032243 RepID=A0AAW3ZX57_9BACT|nr:MULTISPECIES: DNA starvation/stationary phase protection protein [unclassified Campylobacter]MBE2984878.1 DNA starvation/stationary phase protection protein [Campylobacter sp. RM6883]MBE2986311.1 DNA starvation/stationary phase protection protein [Campylobacter sp. RM12919]MBE2988058.1 DNA starvation/stationary phase protection protein [Campylobacter sp. RM12920]MBE2995346.1 DNA starvation/stationary phase protection protein [Campylobacter sp. RM6913]MBE3022431.1 DNA starvation/stationary p
MSKVIARLNKIQADANALYVKFHDLHWNVKGIQFFSIHEYTEKAYDDMSEIFDAVAERAIMLGGTAVVKAEELAKLTCIKHEAKPSYTPTEVLEIVLAEYKHLLKEFKDLDEVAEGDTTTQAYAQEQIAKYEKEIWMLNATLSK